MECKNKPKTISINVAGSVRCDVSNVLVDSHVVGETGSSIQTIQPSKRIAAGKAVTK